MLIQMRFETEMLIQLNLQNSKTDLHVLECIWKEHHQLRIVFPIFLQANRITNNYLCCLFLLQITMIILDKIASIKHVLIDTDREMKI